MSQNITLNSLCRTCMTNTNVSGKRSKFRIYKSIYETLDGDDSNTIIAKLLLIDPQIKVDADDDNMSKIICLECTERLQNAYAFLAMYRESTEKFLKLLREQMVTTMEYVEVSDKCVTEEVANEEDVVGVEKYIVDIEKEKSEEELEVDSDDWLEIEEGYECTEQHINNELDTDDAIRVDRNVNTLPKKRAKSFNTKIRVNRYTDKILPNKNADGTIPCQQCGSVLEDLKAWQEHVHKHRLETLKGKKDQHKARRSASCYECEHCRKEFSKLSAYKNHLRIHTGEQPFLCIECGKSFKFASSLNTHMLRHRGVKTVQCPHCPKKFVCSSGLYGHMMVHTKNDKPHVCDICGAAFQMAYLLRKHNLYHKGIKNFPCEFCDLRFVTAEKQKRHIRTHTGEKPYRCKYCDRGFAQSNDCNKHLKQHLGENIFQCELCPLRFPLQRDLRAHFATHKDDDDDTRKRNLNARETEERNIRIKLGLK
ncbi:uncharacterized protein LOC142230566 [Haematobia irritans]|uniref:uncharacterized protein LOC142230566 n=1 Tax=Haematobia irritans TaxID=7368 RepID=UPI003F5077E4